MTAFRPFSVEANAAMKAQYDDPEFVERIIGIPGIERRDGMTDNDRSRPDYIDPMDAALEAPHGVKAEAARDLVPMTPQEAAIAASAMFDPTIRRMSVLITTLIQVTENGDFALWAPLTALMTALRGLNWESANRENAVKFHALCAVSLRALGVAFDVYRAQIEALPEGAPLPPLPAWGDTEIVEMYDLVAARYPQEDRAK